MDYELTFHEDWQARLARKVAEANSLLSTIPGVSGLLLGGSNGRGEPYPLSDVDFLIVADDASLPGVLAEIEAVVAATEARWKIDGFAMGFDAGKLTVARSEVLRAVNLRGADATDLLKDLRWYHALDKGYRGQAVWDPDGLVSVLVAWLNRTRFDQPIIDFRLATQRAAAVQSLERLAAAVRRADVLEGTRQVRAGAGAVGMWLVERWQERQSFGRSATRLERAARQRDCSDLIGRLHELQDLRDEDVQRRIRLAPEPIRYWHTESLRARRYVGEEVTEVQDARDVLLVATHYEFRQPLDPPFPEWLAVAGDAGILEERTEKLASLVSDLDRII